MLLYIVRHAAAGERGDPQWPDDSQRPLTKEGRKRFACAVKKLTERGFAPERIATSPFVRCRQTAEVIAEILPDAELVELDALAPQSRLPELVEWTCRQGLSSVAWVGHAPDVDEMAAALIGSESAAIRFAKGAVAALEFAEEVTVGEGQLKWLVTAKVLGC